MEILRRVEKIILLNLCILNLFIEYHSSAVIKRPKFVGLYSVCSNVRDTNATKRHPLMKRFSREAISVHLGIFHAINEENVSDHADYEFYDICHNQTVLAQRLSEFLLDTSYFDFDDTGSKHLTTIYGIFTCLSEELTKLAADILSSTNITLVSFNNHSIPHNNQSHPLFIQHGEIKRKDSFYYESFVRKYNYDFVGILLIDEHVKYKIVYKELVEKFRKDTCLIHEYRNISGNDIFHKELINKSAMDSITFKFQTGAAVSLILVIGDILSCLKFIHYFNYKWNATSQPNDLPNIYSIYEVDQIGLFHNLSTKHLVSYMDNYENYKGKKGRQDLLFESDFPINVGSYEYSYVLIVMEQLFAKVKEKIFSQGNVNVKEEMKEIFTLRNERKYYQQNSTRCTNFTCGPGHERQLLPQKDSNWDNNYMFVCSKCPVNFAKSKTDASSKCLPCHGKNVSNENRTYCFVPYKFQGIDISTASSILGFFITSVGLLFCIFTLLVFGQYRKTPVVKASCALLSTIQLLSGIGAFLSLQISVITAMSTRGCIARPLCIGVFYSLFVAVTLAKAELPLRVFLNRKLTEREIKLTMGHQYFLCFILPLASFFLLITSLEIWPVSVRIITNEDSLTKMTVCSTNVHVHVQIIFILLILFACLVQAYRSRNLPQRFRESMGIFCSTFASCVCFLVMIPLHYSQGGDPVKEMKVYWVILSIVGVLLLVSSYWQKVVMIVLHPEKNTVAAFRRASMMQSINSTTTSHPRTLTIISEEVMLVNY